MSIQKTISDQTIVCRTCLKLLNTKYIYLDDENGYITNVGNIREMLQFCIPELDLYVSADPIICYQCLPILVQAYNFKIKCINVESIIKSYITKNNLQDYNHANLKCVVMEELIQNQKTQLECKIKHNVVQESPPNNLSKDDFVDAIPLNNKAVVKIEHGILDNGRNNKSTSDNMIIDTNVKEKLEYYATDEIKHENDAALLSDSNTIVNKNNTKEPHEKHKSIVVRKDLFDTSKSKKKKIRVLNKSLVTKNGRIITKIDCERLQRCNENNVDKGSDEQSKTCKFCNIVFKDPIDLLRHKRTEHTYRTRVHLSREELEPYLHVTDKTKCPLCTKPFDMSNHKEAYRKHILTHSSERNYQCRVCEQVFKRKDLLLSHEERHIVQPN